MDQHHCELIGGSLAIRTVLEDVGYAATTDAKVLITGESGVGKEIVAHLVHGRSRRSGAPFVTLNCAGVPESLLESELFGHVRGSFTGAWRDRAGLLEMANGGTRCCCDSSRPVKSSALETTAATSRRTCVS